MMTYISVNKLHDIFVHIIIVVSLNHDVTSNDDKLVDDTQETTESEEIHKGLIILLH